MPGALWGQPPTGVPPGDRVSSALGAGWAPCGLTVAKDVHCTTARPPPVWGAGPQDLLGMGLGPRIPSRARDTPVQRPPAPPAGPCAGWTVWGPAGDTGAGRRAEDPRACSLPFGLWPQPGVWKPQRGGLQRRGRGVASPPCPHSASRHPSGLPQAPPSPPEDPALRHLLPPGIWMPADGPTLLPQNTGLAMPPQNHPGLSQRVAVGPWTPPDQLPRPHLTALGWDLVPAPAAAQP